MTAIMFETARLLTWLCGMVMFISGIIFLCQHSQKKQLVSVTAMHWKVVLAASIPLLAFTIPIMNGFKMWLMLAPVHPLPASLSVHALLTLQIWLWSSVADRPARIFYLSAAAYPAVMIMVVLNKAGL